MLEGDWTVDSDNATTTFVTTPPTTIALGYGGPRVKKALLAPLALAAMLFTAAPAAAVPQPVVPPPKAPFTKVDPSLFGMDVVALADTEFLGRLGGVRIWDNGVRWDQVEKQQGVYDWDRLDRIVANAKKAEGQRHHLRA